MCYNIHKPTQHLVSFASFKFLAFIKSDTFIKKELKFSILVKIKIKPTFHYKVYSGATAVQELWTLREQKNTGAH